MAYKSYKRGPTKKLGPEQEEEAARMYAAGQKTKSIAVHLGVHPVTLRKALRARGVALRGGGQRRVEFADDVVRSMVMMKETGASLREIAAAFHTSAPTVSGVLTRAGVRLERRAVGARHGQWKGGRFVQDGRVHVLVAADDPLAVMRDRSGYVLENRLVMARHLGRPLLPSETVHHKNNQDTLNNDISNLQLRQGRHGKGGAFQCADCGSHNVIPVPLAEGAL